MTGSIAGTGSFITSGQTGVFVTTGQTGSFVTTSQTGVFVTTGQTGSFITSGQTGNFLTTGQTGGFVTTGQTGSFATTGYVTGVSGYLRTLITSSSAGVGSLSVGGTLVSGSIIFSGVSGINIYTGTSNTIYFSGSPTTISNVVYTTGDQTIIGYKTFNNSGNFSSGLSLGGCLSLTSQTSASSFTLNNNPFYVHTGAAAIWTLPTIASTIGRTYLIKNKGAALTLSGNGSDTLYSYQATGTFILNSGDASIIVNDGTNWSIM
jgi:hypothetical protein